MNRLKKILIAIILIIPFMAIGGCGLLNESPRDNSKDFGVVSQTSSSNNKEEEKVYVSSIELASKTESCSIYLVTYSNGETSTFEVKNGKDASITDIYNEAVKKGFEGDFLAFLKEYLSYENIDDASFATNIALRSAVSVCCEFQRTYLTWGGRRVTDNYGSAGSGVILDLDKENGNAYIITNHHVVYDAYSNASDKISELITVYLYGLEYNKYAITAQYVGGSINQDIAILKIENSEVLMNSDAMGVSVADSGNIKVGEKAIAIGNPEAQGISATSGIISVDSEYISLANADYGSTEMRVMRIDTAVNSGNSGGGLFNNIGQLIGIVNAKVVDESIENIAYAIPSNLAISVARNIIYNHENNLANAPTKVELGITLDSSNVKCVYDSNSGKYKIIEIVRVAKVEEQSLAIELGLQVDDVIQSIQIGDGEVIKVERLFDLSDNLFNIRKGDNLKITVLRNSNPIELNKNIDLETYFKVVN